MTGPSPITDKVRKVPATPRVGEDALTEVSEREAGLAAARPFFLDTAYAKVSP
ncbi:hypothetical protein Nocox_17190 [Nonomuraea coxensis DSM 45129]|uniref:Uncharacterized protein n=1 Tax=Nonomuraea coxensis DSM 45129 TaxID=1122611 RepID=A0ABX8TZX0_9ACTN|nr:hypothetical protein [Nonomuraea coxensis]QYC41050.1 hypothetical protein Nocox_17190 [Nonomuraea coxensis DSM 45129]